MYRFLKGTVYTSTPGDASPGGVWGGGSIAGAIAFKPSPAGFFGDFLAGTRKSPSGGTGTIDYAKGFRNALSVSFAGSSPRGGAKGAAAPVRKYSSLTS